MSRLLGFYPPTWRERYGAEMEDLLIAQPPTLADRFDLLHGAFDAWIHPQVRRAEPAAADDGSDPRPVTGPAILALLGGALFVVSGLAMATSRMFPSEGYKDTGIGVALLIVGILVTSISALFFATEPGPRRVAGVMIGGSLMTMLPLWPILIVGFLTYILATITLGILLLARRRWLGLALVAIGVVLPLFNTEDERALAAVPVGLLWILFGLAFRPSAMKTPTARATRETAAG